MSYIQGLKNVLHPGVIQCLTSRGYKMPYIQGLSNVLHPGVESVQVYGCTSYNNQGL